MCNILVHHCFNPQFETLPAECSCAKWVKFKTADLMLDDGEAVTIKRTAGNGKIFTDTKNIVSVGKKPKVPRAPTVERAHIERAYITGGENGERERRRIEAYGALNELSWIGLGAEGRRRGQETPAVPAARWGMTHQGAVIVDVRMPAGADRKGVNVPKEIPAFCESCQADFDAGNANAGKCPKCGAAVTVTSRREGFGDGAVAAVPA